MKYDEVAFNFRPTVVDRTRQMYTVDIKKQWLGHPVAMLRQNSCRTKLGWNVDVYFCSIVARFIPVNMHVTACFCNCPHGQIILLSDADRSRMKAPSPKKSTPRNVLHQISSWTTNATQFGLQLWPWLPVITGDFYGMRNILTDGVTFVSTYNW